MNIRRHAGLLLVISGVCLLVGLSGSNAFLFRLIAWIGTVLFILSIPGVHAFQPGGPIGLAGIILVELAAFIALGFQVGLLSGSSHANAFALAGSLAGLLGSLAIGWLTIRRKVFPAWVGWAFITCGLLNFIGGVFHPAALANVFPVLVALLGAAAFFGYGLIIFLRQEG